MNLTRLSVIIGALPVTLTNGTTADATQVMSDLNWIVNQTNANAAELGVIALINANNNFTTVQSGIAATQPANFPIAQQVQNSSLLTLSSTAGQNTITARVAEISLTAYVSGQIFSFVPASSNSGSATLNIDSVGAATIFRDRGRTLGSNDLISGRTAVVRYRASVDGLGSGFDLINPGIMLPAAGPSLTLPFSSTSAPAGVAWMGINQLPLASNIDVTNDAVIIHSNSLGTHARRAPSGLAGLVLLQSQTVSGAATVDFATGISSAYGSYVLTCANVIPGTDAVEFWLRASIDGGATFLTTNAYIHSRFSVASDGTTTGAGSSGATDQIVFRGAIGNASTEHFEAVAYLQNLASASVNKGVHGTAMLLDSATAFFHVTFGGNITTNSAVNALRLMMSSGTISGTFSLYGIRQ